jgi:hypothetical protein
MNTAPHPPTQGLPLPLSTPATAAGVSPQCPIDPGPTWPPPHPGAFAATAAAPFDPCAPDADCPSPDTADGPTTAGRTDRTLHVYAATYSYYSLSLATTQSSIAELLLLFNDNILGCWTTTSPSSTSNMDSTVPFSPCSIHSAGSASDCKNPRLRSSVSRR